jgi:5'-3' exonuclease
MGIRYLNQFLQKNANKSSIQLCNLSELSGKKIAVDISIYLYRYIADNSLIDSMYLMLILFRTNNITPVFIFDGKPPEEKKNLLQKRKIDKINAKKEYNNLKQILETNKDLDNNEKQEISMNMEKLKKSFITIRKNDIENVKKLIRAYGSTYYDAPGEADELCAYLTIQNKVWGCLSEDMDMFVYGCPRVLRYLSLLNRNVVVYDVKHILNDLQLDQRELREICVLSGTDYNINQDTKLTLLNTLKYFKKYDKVRKNIHMNNENEDENDNKNKNGKGQTIEFYKWLQDNYPNLIDDYEGLIKIYYMFDLNNYNPSKYFDNIYIKNSNIDKEQLNEILKEDGFIFPDLSKIKNQE